jgi:pyruvate/2-oxoglutarate dehydrogenase complex dihydrolipoamide acyltransferase (E2) component
MSAGVATIDVSAKSPPPTDDELKSAAGRVIAPMVYDNMDFTELRVVKWLKALGDKVGRGDTVAVVTGPLGDMVVHAPVSGKLDGITVDEGIYVIEGKEIGIIR